MNIAACAAVFVSCSIQLESRSAESSFEANTPISTIPIRPRAKKITDGREVTTVGPCSSVQKGLIQ